MLWRAAMARIDTHVRRHAGAYLLVLVVFALGLALGALAARLLPGVEREAIWQAAAPLVGGATGGPGLWWRAVAMDVGIVALLWALGMTVVGVPAVLFIVGMRAVATGFAVAFVVQSLGVGGLAVALASIALPGAFLVPAEWLVAVEAIAYGQTVFRRLAMRRRQGLWVREDRLGAFAGAASLAAVAAVAAALIDVAVSVPAAHFVLSRWQGLP